MRFFIILIIVTLATLTALPSHAATTYLDGDTATIPSTQMKPGDYVRYKLPWDTTFSSVHGDDENVDSEVIAGPIDIRVHLGNDAEVITILDNGQKAWETTIAQQPGFCWSCNKKGNVDVELILTCTGTLQVYVNNNLVHSKSGLSTSTALQVYTDNDAKLIDQGTYYNCNVTLPDYHANTTSSSNFKLLAAAVGGIVLLGVGLALAFRG